MRNKILLAALVLSMTAGAQAVADGHLNSATSKSDVYWFSDGTDTGGESRITRTSNMIVVLLEAENLVPGDAHTIWFVVFNNPEACTDGMGNPGPCDDNDFTPDTIAAAQIAVGNATGNVAKTDGTAEFGGRLVQNENLGGHQVLFGAGFSSPYLLTADPDDAEVHLIVQSHGQARGGPSLLEQLAYVDSNCTPKCEDIQFAVHTP